ncbi:diguanylate cyclase, partial [Chromobacterium sphagni]
MAENLIIEGDNKEEKYQALLPQAHALIAGETDLVAALANLSSALAMTFGWLWTGFYLVKGEQLVLGPFQGPIACTRIPRGRGVCGSAWEQSRTLVVADVDAFPGHIACSSSARSEVVVPIRNAAGAVV